MWPPLAHLTNLIELDLGGNHVDLTPLAGLNNLQTLVLWGNQITDLTLLAHLNNLTELYLGGNQIEDLSPLVANPGLSEGDVVDLRGNPLRDKALTEQIPALRARGVEVIYYYFKWAATGAAGPSR